MAPIYPFPMESSSIWLGEELFKEKFECQEGNPTENSSQEDAECTQSVISAPPPEALVSKCVQSDPLEAFLNNNNLRLFSSIDEDLPEVPNNPPEEDIFNNPIRTNLIVPPAEFNPNDDYQLCVTQKLGRFLDQVNFDDVNRKLHPGTYGVEPIYDTDLSRGTVLNRLEKNRELTQQQKLAIGFLMYGETLSPQDAKVIFGKHPKLFSQLQELNLIVAEQVGDDIRYRLNDLTLTSHRLPNGETMYLFAEIPAKWRSLKRSGEPTAQISSTSYFLLHRLEKEYKDGVKYSGVAADFGAGTGIQAIALLKMYPQLSEVIALDIDKPSMNLNRLNGMMNGVSDRMKVIDNMDTKNLARELNGRKLDLAVSNPPFNITPKGYEQYLGDFGNGGEHGIDVTKIFFDQAIPELKSGAKFIFYSQLARNEKREFFASLYLKEKFVGIEVTYENYENPRFENYELSNITDYAFSIAHFIQKRQLEASSELTPLQLPGIEPRVDKKIQKDMETKLKASGVYSLSPRFVQIVKREDGKVVFPEEKIIDLPGLKKAESPEPDSSRKGGVYIQFQQIDRRGGVYEQLHQIPRRGGVYRTIESVPSRGGVYLRDEPVARGIYKERQESGAGVVRGGERLEELKIERPTIEELKILQKFDN
jgi:methylase of polypeptide subunit release factors